MRAQLERRDAQHDVHSDRTLQRKRLQRKGAGGTAEQDIGASTD